jgi:hypothetical protein
MESRKSVPSPVQLADLALGAIQACKRLGMRDEDRWELEDRWSRLWPGHDPFSSRSSPSALRVCIIEMHTRDLEILRVSLPESIMIRSCWESSRNDIESVRLEGDGLPPWCAYPEERQAYARGTVWMSDIGASVASWTGVSLFTSSRPAEKMKAEAYPRCKTCRHWKPNSLRELMQCRSPQSPNEHFFPKPTFGCIHHETREEAK